MRIDAQRNRERGVAAARPRISAHGPRGGVDAIAVVESSISQLADETEGALTAVRAGADLAATFRPVVYTVAARHSQDRALKDAARGIGVLVPAADGSGPQTAEMERALGSIVALVTQAMAAGVVRSDTTLTDMVVLLDGVPGPELGVAQRERYLDVVLRCLTT